MKSRHDVIVIRPGLVYLFFSFMPIVLGVTYFWVLGKALPSDNPEVDKMARWILLLFFLIVGIVSGLHVLLTKIKIDNEKIEITRFPLKRKEYFWFNIWGIGLPMCDIYSRKKNSKSTKGIYRLWKAVKWVKQKKNYWGRWFVPVSPGDVGIW